MDNWVTMHLNGVAYKAEELYQLIQAGRDSNVMSTSIHQTTKKKYTWHDKVSWHIIYVKVGDSLGHLTELSCKFAMFRVFFQTSK